MSAISEVFWPGVRDICGADAVLAGITVNKGGYHSTRDWLRRNRPDDYSIQTALDQQGPGNTGSAIDVTFKTAQAGNYRNIAKYTRRLIDAGKARDPRTYPLREIFGNADLDNEVEGWSFYRGRAATSDTSHRWHIHFSFWRKYINDPAAMRAVLSILRGEETEDDMPYSKAELKAIIGEVIEEKLDDIADAVLKRDGVIENWTETAATNTHRSLATSVTRIGRDVAALKDPLS